MSDYADKPPIQHEHIMQRPRSVDQLLDATVLGIAVSAKPWSLVALDKTPEDSWEKKVISVKGALAKLTARNSPPDTRAQARAIMQQLTTLDSLPAAERKVLLQELTQSEQQFATLKKSAETVHQAMSQGLVREAIERQYQVISAADAVSRKALLFEFDSLEQARKKSADPATEAAFDDQLDDVCACMAAPLIERARLSAFLSFSKQEYQAEKMLAEAIRVQIPSQALRSPFVDELKRNTAEQLAKLRVENNLLEVYDKNIDKLTTDPREKIVTEDSLKAARAKSGDEDFRTLAKLLSDNFKYLTRNHWPLFGKKGITRSDIVDYDKERSKNINDFKL